MTQEWIFMPLLIMVLLTFSVGIRMLNLRVRAVQEEGVNPHHFLLNRGAKLPTKLVQVEQHYQNLFELPMLFYLLAVILFITQQVTIWQFGLACGFVVFRLWHSWIHLGNNRLLARRNAFLASAFLLATSWLTLAITLIINSIG